MKYKMYVGGYSNDKAGIHQIEYDASRNEFTVVSTNNESVNPIHILVNNGYLFSANEIDEVARVSSFKIEDSGALRLVQRIDGPGYGTCDISVAEDVIFGANYGSGNIFSVVIDGDGQLSEVMSNMEHIGAEPRAHSTIISKDGKYLYEANLGLDRLFQYEVYPEGILRNHPVKNSYSLNNNEGPRHMTIDQTGENLYVITEYGNNIYHYQIDPVNGALSLVDEVSLVDDVECYAADIHISPDGRYLYASLRGPNEIVKIAIDEKMEVVQRYDSGGMYPRSFKLSADGKYMFITNQMSNNLAVCAIDNEGNLSEVLSSLDIYQPTALAFY